MNSLAMDIKDILVEAKFGVAGTDIFVGKEPTGNTDIITIYDTGGGEQDAKFAIDEGTIQIRARVKNYQDGYNKLHNVRKILEGFETKTINGSVYGGIWLTDNISFVFYLDNDMSIWTSNYRIIRNLADGEKGKRLPQNVV